MGGSLMYKSLSCSLVASASLFFNSFVLADQCKPKDPPTGSKGLATQFEVKGRCDSLLAVLERIFRGVKQGGRGLEPNAKFNKSEAMKEVDKARADQELSKELAAIRSGEPDEIRRLALEAAFYEEKLLFGARDLIIQDIQIKLK
jgi:hypothetical protein